MRADSRSRVWKARAWRSPRHQAIALKHDPDLAAKEREFAKCVVTEHAHAAAGRLEQSGDEIEYRRFSAAGLAEDSHSLTPPDRERQSINRDEFAAAAVALKHFADVIERNNGIVSGHGYIARSETAR
jgi:hypothetical protein